MASDNPNPTPNSNPNFYTTPAASSASGLGNPPIYECTNYGPSQAPKSSAAGGNPGYVFNSCHQTGVSP